MNVGQNDPYVFRVIVIVRQQLADSQLHIRIHLPV